MSKKSLSGQLNMFEYFRDLENASAKGETEMVSLMPQSIPVPGPKAKSEPEAKSGPKAKSEHEAKSEPEAKSDTKTELAPEISEIDDSQIAMHKCRTDSRGKVISEITYVNYNKVILFKEGVTREFQFDNSKEAVDFYVDEMMKL